MYVYLDKIDIIGANQTLGLLSTLDYGAIT